MMQKAVADASTADASTADPSSIDDTPTMRPPQAVTMFPVLIALSFCHLLNDMMQSMISALYPMFKRDFNLDYAQVGVIALTFQLTAALLQPVVGMVTDKRPMPFSIATGMGSTLIGLLLLSVAHNYSVVLLAAALVGIGSAVFHPESSRVARVASGGRYGMAQSLFQVGGNAGGAIGPLIATYFILTNGQSSVAWVSLAAMLGMLVLTRVGFWYRNNIPNPPLRATTLPPLRPSTSTQISFESTVPCENGCATRNVRSTTSSRYVFPRFSAGTTGRSGALSGLSITPPSFSPKMSTRSELVLNFACSATMSWSPRT